MAIIIGEHRYYRTAEACTLLGISRATLFRWLGRGLLENGAKDRNGWHLFSDKDLEFLSTEANRVQFKNSENGIEVKN